MTVRGCAAALVGLGILVGFAATEAATSQVPTLEQVLARAAEYVTRFDVAFSNVVSEERYLQATGSSRAMSNRRRELHSDFLMVKLPNTDNWIPFRDVFSVDGQPVRDRDNRLLKLLATPDPLAVFQAQAIVDQSASFNIGVTRTMNLPILGLHVLRGAMQSRFAFARVETADLSGTPTFRIDFEERAHPTVITGPGGRDMAMHGQIWLEPDGTVAQTELWISDPAFVRVVVTTRFQADGEFGVAIPIDMHEEYVERSGRRTTGVATYSRFRQFAVSTSSEMDRVK